MNRPTTTSRWRLLHRLVGVLALLSLPAAVASMALPGIAQLRGDRLYVVMSGSMSPVLEAGDAVLVRPVQPDQLRPGMIITYKAGGTGAVTTHRITELRTVDGARFVQTKGDANASPDPDLTPVEGVVASLDVHWKGVGRWVVWAQSREGRLLLLGPSLVLLSASQLLAHLCAPARGGSTGRRPRTRRPAGSRPRRPSRAATCAMATFLVSTVGLAGLTAVGTRAALADVASVPGNTLTTGTLAAPTGLAATVSGTTVTLTWTATTTAAATGYEVLRGTAAGGPYTVIATVAGRTTTSYADGTASGTMYYVVRSVLQGWTSVNSGAVTATVNGKTTTALTSCTSQSADSGGNGNGYELTPVNACTKDTAVAQDVRSGSTVTLTCADPGKDRHRFFTYGLPVPPLSTVNGIEVQLVAGVNNTVGTGQICVQLSGDAGVTWTTVIKTTPTLGLAQTTYLLGGTGDLWGSTWTPSQLSDANFRVRVVNVDDTKNKTFMLDYVGVRITYTP